MAILFDFKLNVGSRKVVQFPICELSLYHIVENQEFYTNQIIRREISFLVMNITFTLLSKWCESFSNFHTVCAYQEHCQSLFGARG